MKICGIAVRSLIGPSASFSFLSTAFSLLHSILLDARRAGCSFTNLTLLSPVIPSSPSSRFIANLSTANNRPGKTDGQSPPTGKANPNSENGPTPPENTTPMHPTRASKHPRMHVSTDSAQQ